MKFNQEQIQTLQDIITTRRDVRGHSFLDKKIPQVNLDKILQAGLNAPSVGYSQPWKFVIIDDDKIKQDMRDNFDIENEKAKEIFKNHPIYKNLKLEGITEAPINIAVFYKHPNEPTIGMTSIEKMGEYSVVCAVENMWLMARALGIGLGWISILDEQKVLDTLNTPQNHQLVAYLALGFVDKFYDEPELKTAKWKDEKTMQECVIKNKWA